MKQKLIVSSKIVWYWILNEAQLCFAHESSCHDTEHTNPTACQPQKTLQMSFANSQTTVVTIQILQLLVFFPLEKNPSGLCWSFDCSQLSHIHGSQKITETAWPATNRRSPSKMCIARRSKSYRSKRGTIREQLLFSVLLATFGDFLVFTNRRSRSKMCIAEA